MYTTLKQNRYEKKRLLLCITIFPLLIASLAGCSREKDDEDFDGIVYKQVDGGKIYVFERDNYPDSVRFMGRKIPCKRIPRAQLPAWAVDVLYGELGFAWPSVAYQAEFIDSGESVYLFYNGSLQPRFKMAYYSNGNKLDIYNGMNTRDKDPMESEVIFVNAAQNWRCIHMVTNFYEK